MFGESKFEVLEKVPASIKPKTILIKIPTTSMAVLSRMKEFGLKFPLIFKPDLGERGWLVRKIENEEDVESYLREVRIDFLAQELVDLPLEYGVFYVRYPNELAGRVTSIVGKEMLSVKGDGKKTLQALIMEKERAKLQWETLKISYRDRLNEVIPRDENVELVSIGNHCLGTKFLNENHLINEKSPYLLQHAYNPVEWYPWGEEAFARAVSENKAIFLSIG